MSKNIFVVVFILLSIKSIANKKDGIYFSIEEYENNTPSLIIDLEKIDFSNTSTGFFLTLSKLKLDRYIQTSNLLKQRKTKAVNILCIVNKGVMYLNHGEKFYGYSGHDQVYSTGTNEMVFVKVIIDGRILLTAKNKIFKIREKWILHDATPNKLKKIMKDDPELILMYKKEKEKEDKIIPYIKLYNERNPL